MKGGSGRNWYLPASMQHVDVLDAARADAHLDLARAGRRRIGHVVQRQHLRTAECLADGCFHERSPQRCPLLPEEGRHEATGCGESLS